MEMHLTSDVEPPPEASWAGRFTGGQAGHELAFASVGGTYVAVCGDSCQRFTDGSGFVDLDGENRAAAGHAVAARPE